MGPKCNGCDAVIYDISYMECSQESCQKLYHLKCLAITMEKFEALTQEYKNKWVCPECVRTIPKRDNSNTPVRGSTVMNKTFTPGNSYVNIERGSRNNPNDFILDNENKPYEELRQFYLDIISRLDDQTQQYALLQNRFIKTENELKELKKTIEVVREKANKVDVLEGQIQMLLEKNERLLTCLNTKNAAKDSTESHQVSKEELLPPKTSFVDIVKKKQKRVTQQKSTSTHLSTEEYVATKATGIATATENISETCNEGVGKILLPKKTGKDPNKEASVEVNERNEEGSWILVNKKKNRYPNSEVKKGGGATVNEIQGTERKKYLHIWRLEKETKEESVEKYVKSICGSDVYVKVEKIKHKTERDYASFIVGVPVSKYDELCKPENWPVNIEFCEWVWFRRFNKNANK